MRAFGQVINDKQNRIFNNGALRPDRFSSNAYPNWVQWKSHFVAVAEKNRWTDIQAINALPGCIHGHELDDFHTAPTELKQASQGDPDSTLRPLFEHLDRASGVLSNDRLGRSEFKNLVQKEGEGLREFVRRVRNTGMLVYANVDAEQRDEQFRERFSEGLNNAELIEVLLIEGNTTSRETVDSAVALEAIAESIRSRPNKRVGAIRVTHDATILNSNQEVAEKKQQLKRLTDETNRLTEIMTQFISTVDPV